MPGVIIGDGGHARVLQSLVGFPMLGPGDDVPEDCRVVIGVGEHAKRRELFLKYRDRVAGVSKHGDTAPRGFQRMCGAIVQPGCSIGENVLVNTGAQIDHDCRIGNHCTISPGAILCGGVTLGEGCFVGAGAIIIQGVTLEPDTFVPAGALVVKANDFRLPQPVQMNR